MPLSLSSIAIEEKNKLATDSVFLICLEIEIPGLDETVRVVRNNEDLIWKGETWVAFPFEIDEIGDVSKGEVPQVNVRVSNVSRALEAYLYEYDTYCKNNGFSPITVKIYVVNTKVIQADGDADPEVEHEFELKQPKTDSKWATFVLGASNPFTRRFPRSRIQKNSCRYRLGDARCGYTGTATACDKTLTMCRALGNSTRFGGFPGGGSGGLKIAS